MASRRADEVICDLWREDSDAKWREDLESSLVFASVHLSLSLVRRSKSDFGLILSGFGSILSDFGSILSDLGSILSV